MQDSCRVAFGVISWLVLLLTALLNQFQIGIVEPHLVFTAIGVVLMATGVVLRAVAMRTLGKFFTRTLQIREGHHVVSDGIYRRIRHPGYLGDIVLFVGSGIATSNVITTVLILGMILTAFCGGSQWKSRCSPINSARNTLTTRQEAGNSFLLSSDASDSTAQKAEE